MLGRFLLDVIKHAFGAAGAPRSAQPAAMGASAPGQVIPLDGVRCLVKSRHGWFLANRYDRYIGAALIRYGECGEIEQSFVASLLGSGDGAIDVGANIGVHTVGMSRAVGPTGTVVAVEAQPAIFQVLCANLALNGLLNVRPHECGCGAQAGSLLVPIVDYGSPTVHNSGALSLARAGPGMKVGVVPLDDLAGDISSLRLIKVDVEGMEKEVLQGAAGVIERHRPLLYLENDRPENSRDLIEWIVGLGYRLWWHAPRLFNPQNFFGVGENDYPSVMSLNMFCQPAEAALEPAAKGLAEITDPDHHPLRG